MRHYILEDERSIHGALARPLTVARTVRGPGMAGDALRLGRPTPSLRAADFLCQCVSSQIVDTLLTAARGLFYLGTAVVITAVTFYLLILVVLAR